MMTKPRFEYRHDSTTCQGRAEKTPTGITARLADVTATVTTGVYTGLHGWHCVDCGKRGIKVTRREVKS